MSNEFTDQEIFESTMNSCMEMKARDLEKFIIDTSKELQTLEGGNFIETYIRRNAGIAAYEKRTHVAKQIPENRHNEIMKRIEPGEHKIDIQLERAFKKLRLPGTSSLYKLSMIFMVKKYEQRLSEGKVRRPKPTQTIRRPRRRL